MTEFQADEINPEVGGILHLDHVNFETPDHDMATVFFMNGLGLTRDPYRRADEQNMGVNVGLQQFHLPRRGKQTPPFHGIVGMVVPDMAGIRQRFEVLDELGKLKGTAYSWDEEDNSVLLTSPFGFRIRLHANNTTTFTKPLGIKYIEFWAPPGSAGALARFYDQVLRAPTLVCEIDGAPATIVTAGPHQQIRFLERALDNFETYTMHLSYHVTNYNQVRTTLGEHGALKGISRGEVFFFDKVYDPENGETILKLTNEVRSVYHPDFMRPLINRWPMNDEPFTDQTTVMQELARNVGFMPGTPAQKA